MTPRGRRQQVPYQPGDALAVPIGDGRFAMGAISRADGRGRMLVYFFAPSVDRAPQMWRVPSPSEAIWVAIVGDLHVLDGSWQVISTQGERPQDWPIPDMKRDEPLSGRVLRLEFDDVFDLPVRETPAQPEDVENLPEEGVAGAVYAERRLKRLLG